MNILRICKFCGRIMIVMAALMLLPIIVALIYDEAVLSAFLIPMAIFLVLGLSCGFLKPKKNHYDAKEGFVITSLSWILISVIGALPFVISNSIPNYIDALFETVSGFTTTGSSIIPNVGTFHLEHMFRSVLFWRSFTHWVGGMGVLAFGIALIPVFKGKNNESGSEAYILKAESPGPTYGKIVSKLRFNTRIMYAIYLVMTLIQIVLLLAGGMPLFDSLINTFGTAGTGGFGIRVDSIASYSTYCQMVIGVFMILFGINFNVYYLMLIGKFKAAFKHEEMRWYLAIVTIAIAVITANLISIGGAVWESFRLAFFQVASIITTTGFATTDFNLWPTLSKAILVVLMFIGACAGSTGGGLKVSRIIILIKTAIKDIRHSINPRCVRPVKCDGETIDNSVIRSVCSYFAIYMMIVAISTLIVSNDGFDLTTGFTSVVACLNNIGPGLEKVGPTGNYSDFSVLSKIVLSADMLLGRLEIIPIMICFTPGAWKRR